VYATLWDAFEPMKRNALMLFGAAIYLVVIAGTAVANPPTWSHAGGNSHPAPAPLLAAGIPAFVAVGGAAAVRRFLRRRKGKQQQTT
jgi:hypothetical protein